jgi:hypothetical protein
VKFAVEIGSRAMICIPSFIEIGSGRSNVVKGNPHTCS